MGQFAMVTLGSGRHFHHLCLGDASGQWPTDVLLDLGDHERAIRTREAHRLASIAGATRAAECAIAALLLGFGAADGPGAAALTGYTDRTLRNWAGTETGTIRPAADWPD